MINCLSIAETDKVIYTMETDIVKLVVEIESFGMISDEFDKENGSSNGFPPKQADLNCIHALNELHLHEIRVVLNNSEYFFGLVTPFSSIVGQMSGPFSMDSRIIHPCFLFIMYSSILLFQEAYISFSNIGGRLSAPERIALSARVVIVKVGCVSDAFLTEEICAIDDFKDYKTVFMNVDVLMNQPKSVVSTQGTHRSTPRAHRTPTLIAIQEKIDEEEIEKMVEGEEDEESYASAFADSIFNDDVGDSEKKDEEVVQRLGKSRSRHQFPHQLDPIGISSSDKTVSEELTDTISPTTATTSKDSSTTKCKKRSFSLKTKILPRNSRSSRSLKQVPHTYDQIKSMVEKQIEEDRGRQMAIMNLAHEFDNAYTAKDDLRKAYEECKDIPLEQRTLIDSFLKIESDKDYEMHNALFRMAAKLEKRIIYKISWIQQI
ncbi:hypothetical protein Tco_0213240 [Tanacetum coccineum]